MLANVKCCCVIISLSVQLVLSFFYDASFLTWNDFNDVDSGIDSIVFFDCMMTPGSRRRVHLLSLDTKDHHGLKRVHIIHLKCC